MLCMVWGLWRRWRAFFPIRPAARRQGGSYAGGNVGPWSVRRRQMADLASRTRPKAQTRRRLQPAGRYTVRFPPSYCLIANPHYKVIHLEFLLLRTMRRPVFG